MHLDLIVIYAERIEDCRAFYTDLGIHFDKERHGAGPKHYAATLGPTVLELYPAGHRPHTGRLRLGLTIPADASPKALPPGQHILTDPDGRTVAVTVTDDDLPRERSTTR